MNILEVNDNDIYGKIFNGYNISEYLNEQTGHSATHLVVNKLSDAAFVSEFFKHPIGKKYEQELFRLETQCLSVHSMLSITSDFLENSEEYQQADLVHYQQFHNSHLSLPKTLEMAKRKPTIVSFHDPWFTTGRCVHPGSCEKWKNGCVECDDLSSLFPFTVDNCHEMWKIKKRFFEQADVDVIVHSQYMRDLLKENPYTKDLHIHTIPFGLDVKKYNFTISKEQARKSLGIPRDSIVLFFRALETKGIKYIIEALKKLDSDKEIVLMSCSETGWLGELKDKYTVLELGNLNEARLLVCYNACDIFLMPSLGESFGMMAVEAMAAGKPVIVFDNTALPSVTFAPECGVLVKNRDSAELREKLKFLIDNPEEVSARGALGRKLVEEHYDIAKYYQSMVKVYEESFQRQSYKLSSPRPEAYKVDYTDKYVQAALCKLSSVAEELFPFDCDLPVLSGRNILTASSGKIPFSNEKVIELILQFNKEVYNKVAVYVQSYMRCSSTGFRKLRLYRVLRNSSFLRRIVKKLRQIIRGRSSQRLDYCEMKIAKLERSNAELLQAVQILNERMEKLNEQS